MNIEFFGNVSSQSSSIASLHSDTTATMASRSFTGRGSMYSGLGQINLSSKSSTVAFLNADAVKIHAVPAYGCWHTDRSVFSTQYPIASVMRTADEIGKLLRQFVPNVPVISSRELPNPWKGSYPLLLVTPAAQRVHQVFTGGKFGGLSGNPNGVFNRYAIRYVGLPTDRDWPGTTVQEAQSKYWYTMELVIRAIKKDSMGTMNDTVIRIGDEIDVAYTEGGSYTTWRGGTYLGGLVTVSVFEKYRPYGL